MLHNRMTRSPPLFARVFLISAVGIGSTCLQPAVAEQPAATLQTLLDKAQIQDLLVDYYGGLGSGKDDFGAFYVDDGVLDVNGQVAQGKDAIAKLYKDTARGTPPRKGAFRMLLNNPKVVVNGDTATADVIWTGVISETVKAIPQFAEQGREHDELVKRNGRWYFKHRIITSDGGLPDMFEKSYQKR
jgi:ketosteroid isomerase-like protein